MTRTPPPQSLPVRLALATLCAFVLACQPAIDHRERTVTGWKTPQPPAKKAVDFMNPQREYKQVPMRGWTVWVDRELTDEHAELSDEALADLEQTLGEVLDALPEKSHALLRRLPIFLMLGEKSRHGGRNNGLQYFQRSAPKHRKWLDPRMASSVLIYSASNFDWLSDFWKRKAVVHEFAHAWQLEQWPENQADIVDAYRNAVEKGLYQNVKDDKGKTLEKGYCLTNQLEYFAELSCMYFVGCNYDPMTREELAAYDPKGHAMVLEIWGIGD